MGCCKTWIGALQEQHSLSHRVFGKLLTLNQSLALGFPLKALRSVGASLSTSSATYFLARRLLAAAPRGFDPEAARRDLAQLRRDRRAARPAHDATRAAGRASTAAKQVKRVEKLTSASDKVSYQQHSGRVAGGCFTQRTARATLVCYRRPKR